MGPNYTPVLFCPSAYFGRNSIQVAPWPTIRCPTSWSAANRLRRRWPLRITAYNFGMVGLSDCRIPAQFGTPADYGPQARPSFETQQRLLPSTEERLNSSEPYIHRYLRVSMSGPRLFGIYGFYKNTRGHRLAALFADW